MRVNKGGQNLISKWESALGDGYRWAPESPDTFASPLIAFARRIAIMKVHCYSRRDV
jgi:hypothetical protein